MEWTQFAIFFIGVFGLFIWNRAEGRSDARHMDAKLETQRSLIMEIHRESRASDEKVERDFRAYNEAMEKRLQVSVDAIQQEMKDFHEKLLKIEERRYK